MSAIAVPLRRIEVMAKAKNLMGAEELLTEAKNYFAQMETYLARRYPAPPDKKAA
jgi:hypothetical protein